MDHGRYKGKFIYDLFWFLHKNIHAIMVLMYQKHYTDAFSHIQILRNLPENPVICESGNTIPQVVGASQMQGENFVEEKRFLFSPIVQFLAEANVIKERLTT